MTVCTGRGGIWGFRAIGGAAAIGAVALLTGCGGTAAGSGNDTANPSAAAAARPSQAAYSSKSLKSATLDRFGRARPVKPASAATVGELQDKLGLAAQLKKIKTAHPECLTAGPNLTAKSLRSVPASAVTLSEPHRRYVVGEVLFSANPRTLDAVMAKKLPRSCRRITATIGKLRVKVAMRAFRAPHIGDRARGMLMTVAAQGRVQHSWTVMFTDGGYGGSVSVTGPASSKKVVYRAAKDAYRAASTKLA